LVPPEPAESGEDDQQQQHGNKIPQPAAAFGRKFFQKRHGHKLPAAAGQPSVKFSVEPQQGVTDEPRGIFVTYPTGVADEEATGLLGRH
jgi:hypothetical protein